MFTFSNLLNQTFSARAGIMAGQTSPRLLWHFGADVQGAASAGGDFSQVTSENRHEKPKRIRGTSKRNGLLRSVNG